jgi:hypothetical protein
MLQTRYERAGVALDLDRAIHVGAEAVAGTAPDRCERAARRATLGRALKARFDLAGDLGDLDRSIVELDGALAEAAGDPRDHVDLLVALGAALADRYRRTRVIGDLNRATSLHEEAVSGTPSGDPARAGRLCDLADVLTTRFGRLGVLTDLDEAVRLYDDALAATATSVFYAHMAMALHLRYGHTGNVADLDRAVEVAEQALTGDPRDDPGFLSTVERMLLNRYTLSQSAADLERSIDVGQLAIALTPTDHPDQHLRLSTLSEALSIRFGRNGDPVDLDRSISTGEAALAVTPAFSPERLCLLIRLGASLHIRFAATGAPADLDRTIALASAAVNATPPDDPDRGCRLAELADAMARRYELAGAMSDLDGAVDSADAALAATAAAHPERRQRLCEVANLIRRRVAAQPREGDEVLLDRAVRLAEEAAGRSARVSPTIGPSVARVEQALLLRLRYARSLTPADLDRAIGALREAVARLGARDPHRARCLYELGTALRARFDATARTADADAAQDALRDATAVTSAAAGMRLRAGIQWAALAADRAHWGQAALAWEAVLELDPETDGGAVERPDRVDQETRRELLAESGPAGAAAALATGDPRRAWRIFDRGRDVLRSPADDPGSTGDVAPEPGGTLVALNITRWRCDVLLRGSAGIGNVALPHLTEAAVTTRAEALRAALRSPSRASSRTVVELLGWLWDAVTGPVLEYLGHTGPPEPDRWPRVWWLPTGPLTGLPLHAAGHVSVPHMSTVDRVISSYVATPTEPLTDSVGSLWPLGGDLAMAITRAVTAGLDPSIAVHQSTRRQRERYPQHPYLWAPYVHIGA